MTPSDSLLGYFLVGLQASLAHVLTYCLSVIITTLAAEVTFPQLHPS